MTYIWHAGSSCYILRSRSQVIVSGWRKLSLKWSSRSKIWDFPSFYCVNGIIRHNAILAGEIYSNVVDKGLTLLLLLINNDWQIWFRGFGSAHAWFRARRHKVLGYFFWGGEVLEKGYRRDCAPILTQNTSNDAALCNEVPFVGRETNI